MSRFFAPLMCFSLAVWVYMRASTPAVIVFVGVERLAGDDPYVQGMWSARLLFLLGILFLGFALWRGRSMVEEEES